mmetsp:Transcript_30105/g.59963  ORF Transcript_30105/g.59963 Transcript_30105/m.59963 type:complete len:454 (-) Transcript_30105:953-2314(-)
MRIRERQHLKGTQSTHHTSPPQPRHITVHREDKIMRMNRSTIVALAASTASSLVLLASSSTAFAPHCRAVKTAARVLGVVKRENLSPFYATPENVAPKLPVNQPTELPDSLDDAASIAANACYQLHIASGPMTRCRVDFDTSIGDETYTTLKSSTEFMQKYVSALAMACIPGVIERKQEDLMRLIKAKQELKEKQVEQVPDTVSDESTSNEEGELIYSAQENKKLKKSSKTAPKSESEQREEELLEIIANQGADPKNKWTGPKIRIYFPDEGSAALARRDWKSEVPACVDFSSCGGVQVADVSNDSVVVFFCPRASEAEFVEDILYKTEENRGDELMLTVMVNPLLVDMGVTGFGMAGRRLRERLIDGLVPAYYLRTLAWGALTRVWPQLFTVWQEDVNAEGGYKMIKAMDRLPSNPEVEDIYDIENDDRKEPGEGFGLLNAIGDFVNGMTRL